MKNRFFSSVAFVAAVFTFLSQYKTDEVIRGRQYKSASAPTHTESTTSTSSAAPISSKKISYFEEPHTHTTEQKEFEIQLTLIMEQMPTLNQQKKPSFIDGAQIHGFIPEEFREAEVFAKLHKLSSENMKYASLIQKTYAGCSERVDLSNSVRALCFVNALELSLKLKNSQKMVMLDVPVNIRELARKIVN